MPAIGRLSKGDTKPNYYLTGAQVAYLMCT